MGSHVQSVSQEQGPHDSLKMLLVFLCILSQRKR